VSVTEVEVLLSVALSGLVLLPEKSWTFLGVSVVACTASEKLAFTVVVRLTPLAPICGIVVVTVGAVVSGGGSSLIMVTIGSTLSVGDRGVGRAIQDHEEGLVGFV
jgi:hypothetical protein